MVKPVPMAAPFQDVTVNATPALDAGLGTLNFRLVVDEGLDAGLVVPLPGTGPAAILVGQSPVCAVRLRDPRVSRRQATLEVQGSRVRLVDQRSTNGTTVQGVSVMDAWLSGGERVVVGDTAFHVEATAPAKSVDPPPAGQFGRLVGGSLQMRRLYPLWERLARSSVPIVIEGETGTGKEVLAEAIHEHSARSRMPFIVFDCTTVAPALAESELFGHERGSFTGAVGARRGLFEQAHGGTLFLDEIGDLDLSLQPKLLRAVERGEIRRVGSDQSRHVDIRIISATRRNLDEAVAAGRFRDDLFHRLMVGRIEMPPLRSRHGDIAMLARHFWSELGGSGPIPEEVLTRWEQSAWPGNVRALRNTIARTIAVGDLETEVASPDGDVATSATPDWIDRVLDRRLPLPTARQQVVDAFERRYIARLLDEHGGDTAAAAAASGIARRYFNLLRARHK